MVRGPGESGQVGEGGQGGCDRRSDVIVKIPKKLPGVSGVGRIRFGGGGVRVDVNEELKLL